MSADFNLRTAAGDMGECVFRAEFSNNHCVANFKVRSLLASQCLKFGRLIAAQLPATIDIVAVPPKQGGRVAIFVPVSHAMQPIH